LKGQDKTKNLTFKNRITVRAPFKAGTIIYRDLQTVKHWQNAHTDCYYTQKQGRLHLILASLGDLNNNPGRNTLIITLLKAPLIPIKKRAAVTARF
jgi:hypothetical protein